MWNPNSEAANYQEEDDSWEVKAFAEDTGNAMGTTWPPRSYTCTFCRREFRSAQALGGHMNVHRRDRARLHQSQPNLKNSSLSSSSTSSTQLVANSGLCLFYSLPNCANAIFNPSSLHILKGNPTNLVSITRHSDNGNFMNNPAVMNPSHSFNSSLSNSSNTDPYTSLDRKRNRRVTSVGNKGQKTDSAIEGIDLELRL